MIDPERIRLVLTCESCPEQYDAYLDDWAVGYLRMRHGWFTVSFPWSGGVLPYQDKSSGGGNFRDKEREGHLANARRLIAERLHRAPAFQVGQRVRYELRPSDTSATGEGTIVRLPLPGAYCPADMRYRVRHDGGTATDYVEVGALEHEISVAEDRGRTVTSTRPSVPYRGVFPAPTHIKAELIDGVLHQVVGRSVDDHLLDNLMSAFMDHFRERRDAEVAWQPDLGPLLRVGADILAPDACAWNTEVLPPSKTVLHDGVQHQVRDVGR